MAGMAVAEARGKGRKSLAQEAENPHSAEQGVAPARYARAPMAENAQRGGIPETKLH